MNYASSNCIPHQLFGFLFLQVGLPAEFLQKQSMRETFDYDPAGHRHLQEWTLPLACQTPWQRTASWRWRRWRLSNKDEIPQNLLRREQGRHRCGPDICQRGKSSLNAGGKRWQHKCLTLPEEFIFEEPLGRADPDLPIPIESEQLHVAFHRSGHLVAICRCPGTATELNKPFSNRKLSIKNSYSIALIVKDD